MAEVPRPATCGAGGGGGGVHSRGLSSETKTGLPVSHKLKNIITGHKTTIAIYHNDNYNRGSHLRRPATCQDLRFVRLEPARPSERPSGVSIPGPAPKLRARALGGDGTCLGSHAEPGVSLELPQCELAPPQPPPPPASRLNGTSAREFSLSPKRADLPPSPTMATHGGSRMFPAWP